MAQDDSMPYQKLQGSQPVARTALAFRCLACGGSLYFAGFVDHTTVRLKCQRCHKRWLRLPSRFPRFLF